MFWLLLLFLFFPWTPDTFSRPYAYYPKGKTIILAAQYGSAVVLLVLHLHYCRGTSWLYYPHCNMIRRV